MQDYKDHGETFVSEQKVYYIYVDTVPIRINEFVTVDLVRYNVGNGRIVGFVNQDKIRAIIDDHSTVQLVSLEAMSSNESYLKEILKKATSSFKDEYKKAIDMIYS